MDLQWDITYVHCIRISVLLLSNPPPPTQKKKRTTFIDIVLCIKWKAFKKIQLPEHPLVLACSDKWLKFLSVNASNQNRANITLYSEEWTSHQTRRSEYSNPLICPITCVKLHDISPPSHSLHNSHGNLPYLQNIPITAFSSHTIYNKLVGNLQFIALQSRKELGEWNLSSNFDWLHPSFTALFHHTQMT